MKNLLKLGLAIVLAVAAGVEESGHFGLSVADPDDFCKRFTNKGLHAKIVEESR